MCLSIMRFLTSTVWCESKTCEFRVYSLTRIWAKSLSASTVPWNHLTPKSYCRIRTTWWSAKCRYMAISNRFSPSVPRLTWRSTSTTLICLASSRSDWVSARCRQSMLIYKSNWTRRGSDFLPSIAIEETRKRKALFCSQLRRETTRCWKSWELIFTREKNWLRWSLKKTHIITKKLTTNCSNSMMRRCRKKLNSKRISEEIDESTQLLKKCLTPVTTTLSIIWTVTVAKMIYWVRCTAVSSPVLRHSADSTTRWETRLMNSTKCSWRATTFLWTRWAWSTRNRSESMTFAYRLAKWLRRQRSSRPVSGRTTSSSKSEREPTLCFTASSSLPRTEQSSTIMAAGWSGSIYERTGGFCWWN